MQILANNYTGLFLLRQFHWCVGCKSTKMLKWIVLLTRLGRFFSIPNLTLLSKTFSPCKCGCVTNSSHFRWMSEQSNRTTDQSQCNHKATNQIENLKLQRWKMCGFTMQMRKTLLLPNLYESFFNFYYAQCSLVGVAAVLSFISTFPLPVLATIIISFEFFAVATFFPFFHSFHIQCFLSLSLSHSLSLLVSVFRVRFYSCFPFVKSWKL